MADQLTDEVHLRGDSTISTARHILVFFVPGNPGLISYYSHFLITLRSLLLNDTKNASPSTVYHFHGASLAGFDLAQDSRAVRSSHKKSLPLGLVDQVLDTKERLHLTVERVAKECDVPVHDINVVLIGHSIGAYICLEILSQLQIARDSQLNVSASLCLFPTVFELAKSPMGRKVGPLTRIPYFASFMHVLSKLIFGLMPFSVITWLVGLVTKMPRHPARVTASFLQSRWGVWQALHMAKDEIAHLTHDTWSDELWGGAARLLGATPAAIKSQQSLVSAKAAYTKLHFYWGADDHWVAKTTRDNLLATRARAADTPDEANRPVMYIDTNGIGHAFCLQEADTRIVAEKCAEWIAGLTQAT
nr:hypothetical protein B0A51_12722 [Rachicladosporium sp. CCFEE 5018]